MITFGPVPSRRLGRSLGINNVPPKSCTYSCIYCQVGPKPNKQAVPRPFYSPEEIYRAVELRIAALREAGEHIDFLTFVPDGEPTLDVNLGRTMELLKSFGIRIAVISNGSLIWQKEVRDTLMSADWVSLKVDTVDAGVWRLINRPHSNLQLPCILDGMLEFASGYKGILTSETMLVDGINTRDSLVTGVADFLGKLAPETAFLSIPIRPPTEEKVRIPDEEQLNRAYQIVCNRVAEVEYLTGYEGNAFSSTGDPAMDILSITAVHPLREEAIQELLAKTEGAWNIVEKMIEDGKLRECRYEGRKFYIRCYPRGTEC